MMTRAVFSILAAPLAAALIVVPAAQAKSDITKLKTKCTVVAVVFGTGWDVLGGSSSCSMLTDTAKAEASTAKRSVQASKKAKSKG